MLTDTCNIWLTFAQYKHDPTVKAVRVNGQITEVFSMIGRNIMQICQD